MFQRKDPKLQTAQAFLNVEAIEGNILWTRDKRLFAFIRVSGKDNSLLTPEGHAAVTSRLAADLAGQREPFQLLSIPRTADTEGMIRELKELRSAAGGPRLRLLDGEIDALEKLSKDGAKEPLLLLKIWQNAAPNADHELLGRAAQLAERLGENDIAAAILDDGEILRLCRIYAELGVWQPEQAPSDIPLLPDRPRLISRRRTPGEIARQELLEQITPVGGLFFQPTGLMVGGAYCRCYGVTRYPAAVDYGWAVRLMGATDCVTCVTYTPGNEAEIGDALSRSVRASRRDAESQSDVRAKKRYLRKAADADRLIDEQDARGMALGYLSMVTMPFADSPAALEEVCKEVVARYGRRQMKLRLLSQLQKDAFRHLSPYYPDQPEIGDVLRRVLPLETLVGGYPCTVNTLRDDHGVYFAQTPDGSILSLDTRYRGKDRTNGNGILTGVSGTGKSTALKHMVESFYMQGVKVIVVDPEREFRALCRNLNGAWYDAGGGSARVNLLQPQPLAKDPDEAGDSGADPAYSGGREPLRLHIQYVQTILRYKIPSLTDIQLNLLSRTLRELYQRFGMPMDWEYDPSRDPGTYPIMEDLYRELLARGETDSRFAELALLVEDMAVGTDAAIWNGHTNIDLSAPIVVIDTNRLYHGSARNRAAQYYNLMRMAFNKASFDRTTAYAIVADEAQILFDPELPSVAEELKNIAERIRKYEGCLWLAFHSLNELMDDRVRRWGQAILDGAAYKILFGTDGRNLADTVSLFRLTPAEERILAARQRGKALALIGSRHLKVDFVLPPYKLELMGTGGGR